MTVPAQERFTFSSGNGVTTTFPYTFMIPGTVDDPQFLVYLIEITTGTRTDLTVDVDYSISGLGVAEGGVVTYPLSGAPLPATHRIVIESNMPYEQQTDVYNSGTLYLSAIEGQFDNTTRQVQQIQDRVNRTFSVGIGYEGNYELFPVADTLIGWNSDGTGLENKLPDSERAAAAYAAQLAAEAARDEAVALAALGTYASRGLAEVANVPASVDKISVIVNGMVLQYERDASGTALTTGDGAKWSPLNDATPEHWGAVGDGSDETTAVQAMAEWTSANGRVVLWGNKTYAFTKIFVNQEVIKATWRSQGRTVLRSLKTAPDTSVSGFTAYSSDAFIDFVTPTQRSVGEATTTLSAGGTYVSLDDTSDVIENDTLIYFSSTRVFETDNRGQARHGWVVPADRVINSTQIQLAKPIPVTCKVGDITGVEVVSVSGQNVVVSGLSLHSRTDAHYKLVFNTVGGSASTEFRYPTDFDPATQTYTFDASNGPVPAGLTAGDSITVERKVNIFLYHSAKVSIGPGFILERDEHTGATPGDYGYRGLRVSRGIRPKIEHMQVRNFSEAGIVVALCYEPNVSDITAEGSNRAYNVTDGTGYGVACSQSSWGAFRRIRAFGCRRALDFSGTQGGSYHNKASFTENCGGGTAYDGVRFWPFGATENSVVGSHGGGYFTKYDNTRAIGTTVAVNLRGMDEEVVGVYGAGKMNHLVNSFYGDGVIARGLFYTDGVPDWISESKYAYGYPLGGKLLSALRIEASNIIKTKPHMISDIDIKGVKRAIIDVRGAGTVGPITLSGSLNVITDNEEGDYSAFEYICPETTGAVTINGPVFVGQVNLINRPTAPKTTIHMVRPGRFVMGANYWRNRDQYFFTLADDAVIKIPCNRFGTTKLSLRFYNNSRSPNVQITDAQVWAGAAGNKSSVPNATNVDILSTVLTGTTGTDAASKVYVAFAPSNEPFVYVENRYGSEQNFVLECDALV